MVGSRVRSVYNASGQSKADISGYSKGLSALFARFLRCLIARAYTTTNQIRSTDEELIPASSTSSAGAHNEYADVSEETVLAKVLPNDISPYYSTQG